jgi:hypothetical protein
MTVSIPASAIVSVTPNVIDAGGTGLDLSGLVLTNSNRVPFGTVQAFVSPTSVADFFGGSSAEAAFAVRYFAGYDGSPVKPAQLLFCQYAAVAVPGYLRGASLKGMTLAQLQAIAGTITLTIDGTAVTSGAINLSGATSFSNAATIIQTALAHADAHVTAAIATTGIMTVSAVADGALAVGQVITGTNVPAGTTISALGSGTGGTGTYTVSPAPGVAVSSTAITAGATTVAFDSVSNGFVITGGTPGDGFDVSAAADGAASTPLKLTAATGAVTSAGGAASTPGGAMDVVVADTQDFATFTTLFKPATNDMVSFAAWNNGKSNRYVYVLWDNNAALTTNDDSATALGLIVAAGYSATLPIYEPVDGAYKAAFAMGWAASIDFTRVNGRTNLAFRSQAGLIAGVTNQQIAEQLIANGCNFYGSYATANDQFVFFYPGQATGAFDWADSLINEIWMTNAFQLALMSLLTSIPSIPYNSQGYALIEAALADPINAAVSFGAIRAGVPLSALQAAEVNNAAGARVADTISSRGWYLQVSPASAEVRAARGSPPITFWYTDGQSVQKINLNSVEVQ